MSTYVDVVAIPVPNEGVESYRDLAADAGAVWIEHGANRYIEGIATGGDADRRRDDMLTVPELANVGPDETAVVAFIEFDSRGHRDEVSAAVMDDPEYQRHFQQEMPFDPTRMVTGSFESFVDLDAQS